MFRKYLRARSISTTKSFQSVLFMNRHEYVNIDNRTDRTFGTNSSLPHRDKSSNLNRCVLTPFPYPFSANVKTQVTLPDLEQGHSIVFVLEQTKSVRLLIRFLVRVNF